MSFREVRGIGVRMEGTNSMNWIKQHTALVTLLLLVGVGVVLFATGRLRLNSNSGQETAKAEKNGADDENSALNPDHLQSGSVVLDEDVFRTSGIRIAPVNAGSVPVFFEAPGEVQLAEDRIAHITPQIPGVIRAVYKGVGNRVAEGSRLCLIESVELGDSRASYVAAHAEMELAERNYARWKQLYDKGLRTQNELIAAEAELNALQAQDGSRRVKAPWSRHPGRGDSSSQ